MVIFSGGKAKLCKYKIIVFVCVVIIISIVIFFSHGINETPRYDDSVVLDIRNESDDVVQGMYLKVEKTDTYIIPEGEEHCENKICIPEISPASRIVVVLKQGEVSAPGMKLRLNYNNYNNYIIDELHEDTGESHIVTIKKDGVVSVKKVYDYLFDKYKLSCFIPYKEIVILPK